MAECGMAYIQAPSDRFRAAINGLIRRCGLLLFSGIVWLAPTLTSAQTDGPLVGIWTADQGFQTVEYLFRSDGRYQLDTKSTDPAFGFSFADRGQFVVDGQTVTLFPFDHVGEQTSKKLLFEIREKALTLTSEFGVEEVYQFKPGSRADVLARQNVAPDLVRTWTRHVELAGTDQYTFRPDGHYFVKSMDEGNQFPPQYIRGRYEQNGRFLAIKPYGGVAVQYEIDFFGDTLTLIRSEEFSGESRSYEEIAGSGAEVRAKNAQAADFLSRENWQVGIWEIRDGVHSVDLTLRPDGHYISTNAVEILRGIVRGRYQLEPGQIQLSPFPGQANYSRDNGDFGQVERSFELDYYDGELQLIDLSAISQSVAIARQRPGSAEEVLEKARLAQAETTREDWYVGLWEVNDLAGWMEFTFRPDNRYIAKSGTERMPNQVERGQYRVTGGKVTLAPYAGLGSARGFETDYYDGNWFLIGDLRRMVVARRIPGSEVGVIGKTLDPIALKGERGSILGLWTANRPGEFAELVFRTDGQYRLNRCQDGTISQDYGLYTVNMATRTLVSDSRFMPAQTLELDFYGDTLTIHGGSFGNPETYNVNLGEVDAAINASFAADVVESKVDLEWMSRTPIGPRDPNATLFPTAEIPADPNPGRIFESPTVLTSSRLYRRLIGGFVYFNELGTIRSVPVVNTREFYLFHTGRALVRFKNYRAGVSFPNTVADVSDSWAAYRVEAKTEQTDILHIYADNVVYLETDAGEKLELTLEDGRRNLFWGKDYQILQDWASEQRPIPCQAPGNPDASLINTGLSLTTTIVPDDLQGFKIQLSHAAAGSWMVKGVSDKSGAVVSEVALNLAPPVVWRPLQTNSVAAGPFAFAIAPGTNAAAFFRVRRQ